jgi:hypothetical protein
MHEMPRLRAIAYEGFRLADIRRYLETLPLRGSANDKFPLGPGGVDVTEEGLCHAVSNARGEQLHARGRRLELGDRLFGTDECSSKVSCRDGQHCQVVEGDPSVVVRACGS